jgi:hypothetical protein
MATAWNRPRRPLCAALPLVLLLAFLPGLVPARAAPSTTVVISQLYGAGGNAGASYTHDYVELFNRGTAPTSLAGWSVQYASATGTGNFGATSSQLTELPDVTLQPGQYFLVQLSGAGTPPVTADLVDPTPINMAASAGKVALANIAASLGCNGGSTPCSPAQLDSIVDLVGYGAATFSEGAPAPGLSATTAAVRAGGGCQDTDDNATDFAAGPPSPRNSAATAAPCGGPPTFTPTPTSTPTPEPPTLIHDIQGPGHTSPLVGQTRGEVPGVVTALRSNGFYLQDPTPDGDDRTSEALVVFTSVAPTVRVGDAVSVRGTVSEFRPGGSAGSTNLTTTELTGPVVTILSSGNPLPAPVVIGAGEGGRRPPSQVIEDDATGDVETSGVFDPATDGIDFYESLEGMRVQVNNALAVGPTSSFGEVVVLPDGGADAGLRTTRGGVIVRPNDFNPERIMLDDGILPTPRLVVGDRLDGPLVGVVDYSFGNFKLQLTALPPVVGGGLARETTAPPSPSELSVATFNVENLDPADGAAKFDALAAVVVNNLRSPDLVALEEVQDNNGPTNDATVAADQTYRALIDAIDRAGGPAYQVRQIDPVDDQDGGEPGGNIRVGFLFRTDRGLAFVDRPGGGPTTATSVVAGPTGPALSASPGRIDPTNPAFVNSRKPLVGELTYNGRTFFVVANHFNSKGGDQPLFGRFQPPSRVSETQRHQQAGIVHDFVAGIIVADANADVVVLGDLNDFDFSETLQILKGSKLTILMERLPESERYSYVFEGNSQALDHVLISNHLETQPFAYDVVHVNAEFTEQVSDHDPQVARFLVDAEPPTVTYTGNAGVYTVDQSVAIRCQASDALTSVVGTTCQDVVGPAYGFPLGTNTFSATATDAAGNVGTGSTTFTVQVTFPSLCRLTETFVEGSARFRALPPAQQTAARRLAAALCRSLDEAAAELSTVRKARLIAAYQAGVTALARQGWLGQEQATILVNLSRAL